LSWHQSINQYKSKLGRQQGRLTLISRHAQIKLPIYLLLAPLLVRSLVQVCLWCTYRLAFCYRGLPITRDFAWRLDYAPNILADDLSETLHGRQLHNELHNITRTRNTTFTLSGAPTNRLSIGTAVIKRRILFCMW